MLALRSGAPAFGGGARRGAGRGIVEARVGAALAPRHGSEADLPDPVETSDNPALTPAALNHAVTAGYGAMANRLQAIVDPAWAATGTPSTSPVWLALGAHASRQDGALLEAVRLAREGLLGSSGAEGAGPDRERSTGPSRRPGAGQRLSELATLLRDLFPGSGSGFDAAPLLDPIVLVRTLRDAGHVAETAPGGSPGEKLGALLDTLEHALAEANRSIYREVGGLAAAYLRQRAREGAPPTPDDAIASFGGAVDPSTARAVVACARDLVAARAASPDADGAVRPGTTGAALHVGEHFIASVPAARPGELLAAAFVLFEDAARRAPGPEKNALVAVANELIGFGEQFFIVPGAFLRDLQPGEVDRSALFAALTPLLELPVNGRTWRFSEAAARVLPRAGLLTPPPLGHNWAVFADRWPAILDFFALCYRHPEAVWPVPLS